MCLYVYILKCRKEKSIDKQQYQGKFLLLGKNTKDFCLETSTDRKLTSSELEISSLASCKRNANQVFFCVWHDKLSNWADAILGYYIFVWGRVGVGVGLGGCLVHFWAETDASKSCFITAETITVVKSSIFFLLLIRSMAWDINFSTWCFVC